MRESEALWKDVCKLLEGTGLPDGYRRKLLSTIAELVEATVEEAARTQEGRPYSRGVAW